MGGPVSTEERRRSRQRPDSAGAAERAPAGRSPLRWFTGPRRRLAVLVLVLAGLSGGFGTWALYGSSWFRVEHVSVSWTGGPEVLDAREVHEAAAVPVGVPMASLDKDAVRDRVLERFPRVREVQVVRAWPSGVGVKITEREAEVLLPDGDGFTEIDADGVLFAERSDPVDGVPLLELDLASDASVARFGADRIRTEAVGVVGVLPAEVREATKVVRVRSYDAIELELSGGRTVLWGSPEDPSAKATALSAVLKAAPDARHFDVQVPSAPAAAAG